MSAPSWRPRYTFTLTIDLANAAFDDWPADEVARILRDVADGLDEGIYGRHLLDVNGNNVGAYALEAVAP